MKKYFLIILLLLLSCKKNEDNIAKSTIKKQSENAVFIIEENNNKIITSIFNDDDAILNLEKGINYFTDKISDTLRLDLKIGKQLYFNTKNNYRDTLFVTNGDTVRINLQNSRKKLTINNNFNTIKFQKNPEIAKVESNFIKVSIEYPLYMEPTKFEKFKPKFPLKIDFNKIKENPELIEEWALMLKNDLSKGHKFYDSISNVKPALKYYAAQQKENIKLDVFNDLLMVFNFSKNKKVKELAFSDLFVDKNSKLNGYTFRFYNVLISAVVLNYEQIQLGQKNITNYKKAMQLLPLFFTNTKLQFAQIVCIKSAVLEEQSKETVKELITNYKKIKLNKTFDGLIQKIEEDYNLTDESFISTKDVVLKSINGQTTNLKEFLLANDKKIIYIDFWASWCAPCRAALPASRRLHDIYKDKVSFMYISIDKSSSAWQKANKSEDLGQLSSFLATNYPDAEFYKNFRVKTIPRYMIYYKGKLVNSDAPGPNSDEIIKELDKYLAKK